MIMFLEDTADAAYRVFVEKYNAAKQGIADGSLTTAEQVDTVLKGA
jgi:hypothetical protein